MKSLKIVRLGYPSLRLKSTSVPKRSLKSKRVQKFLDDLCAICIKNDGVGIAAPQVGINKRIIVVTVDPHNPRYENMKPFPLTIVINPKITTRSKQTKEGWEGDLSADLRGLVPRPISCTVVGLDRHGNPIKFDLTDDFHARVFQHEIDHLDGVLFLDKVKKKKSFSEYEAWKIYFKGKKTEDLNL
jgi:peptide deformylase